ncbi:MAG TPA: hypothetical protein VFW76_08465, partial [Ktedonobacterales bacterium]|nr:hypothetical protein [Ktedonobacterales bacterium]
MTHEDQEQAQPKNVQGDDLEIHREAMSAPGEPQRGRGRLGRSRPRVARLALGATTLVVLVAVVAGAFALTRGSSGGGGVLGGSDPLSGALRNALHVTPNPTPLPAWGAYPTPTLGLGTPPPLGPLPLSCSPPAPAPRTLPATLAGAIGGSPVWVASFDEPHATKYISPWGKPPTRYGWMVFVTFAVEP